jgi:hypothetical protein
VSRSDHSFQFPAATIAAAADAEAEYHRERRDYWRLELARSIERVRETARIDVREFSVTGGTRVDVVVDYGDQASYKRMQEAQAKAAAHSEQAGRYELEARLYASQGDRVYELDGDDVAFYRLNGAEREA